MEILSTSTKDLITAVLKFFRTANYPHSSSHSEEHSIPIPIQKQSPEVDEKIYFAIFTGKHIF